MEAMDSVKKIMDHLGGKENLLSVNNCMTRLRVTVRDENKVREKDLRECPEVLGLVHDRANYYEVVVGPGKSRKYADLCHEAGVPAAGAEETDDWRQNKERIKNGQKESKVRSFLKVIGEIFVPLIPGVIAAGLCAGFASLISQLVPGYAEIPAWNLIYTLLSLINTSLATYITAWTGYRAAERFGGTPILGGMLGLITSLEGINTIAQILGLFNDAAPLQSILRQGRGGVLAVLLGAWLLSAAENKIREHMPDSMDIIFTPFLSLLIVSVPYILLVMPVFGYVSSGIVWVFGKACMSESIIVRILTGFLSAALFLPMVAAGMHHGMVALYSVQLQELGFITLYPALAMAGAGQVGAALAILKKAKKTGNDRLVSVIRGALPAGFLGVGEPLIYGVTLPMGKPFLLAGLGAGFGGAFVMLMQVASTTWGPSGLLGVFVMTAGPKGPLVSMGSYLIGLVISYVCAFLITNTFLPEAETASETAAPAVETAPETVPSAEAVSAEKSPDLSTFPRVKHGDTISFDAVGAEDFSHVIKDPVGIHARPAGELKKLLDPFDCHFVIEANGKTADAKSVMQLMSLGAAGGCELHCHAEGKDAKEAVRAAREFMEKKL